MQTNIQIMHLSIIDPPLTFCNFSTCGRRYSQILSLNPDHKLCCFYFSTRSKSHGSIYRLRRRPSSESPNPLSKHQHTGASVNSGVKLEVMNGHVEWVGRLT